MAELRNGVRAVVLADGETWTELPGCTLVVIRKGEPFVMDLQTWLGPLETVLGANMPSVFVKPLNREEQEHILRKVSEADEELAQYLEGRKA